LAKQYFLHSQEKKNKMNPRRYQHLIKIIDDDYESEVLQIIKEFNRDQNQDQLRPGM
jgi:hypothetical protein